MVITEKDISQEENKVPEKSKGSKIIKILLFVLAAFLGLFVIGGLFSKGEDNEVAEKKDAPVVAAEKNVEQNVGQQTVPLVFSDISFGSPKYEISQLLKGKGWNLTHSFSETDGLASTIEFQTNDDALFQNHVTHDILLSFDEDDKLQRVYVYFDVSPRVLKNQRYVDLDEKLREIVDVCLLYQGYNEFENLRRDGLRLFGDEKTKTVALFHFGDSLIEKGKADISYMSAIAYKKYMEYLEK